IMKDIAKQKQEDQYQQLKQAQQQLNMVDLIASRKSRHKGKEADLGDVTPLSKPSSETGGARIGESSSSAQKRPVTLVATEQPAEPPAAAFAASQPTERPHSAEPQLAAPQQQQQQQNASSPNVFSQRVQNTQPYSAVASPQSAGSGQMATQYGPANQHYVQQPIFGSPNIPQQYVPVGISAASTASTVFSGQGAAAGSSVQPMPAMGAAQPPLVNLASIQPQPPQPIPQRLNMPAPDSAYTPFSASFGSLPSRSEVSPVTPARPTLPPKPAEWQPSTTSQPIQPGEANGASRISAQPPMPPRRPQQDPQAPALPPKPFPAFSEYDFAPDVPEQPAAASSSGQGGHVEQLRTLMNMGFSEPQAIQALEMYDYDVNKASNYLIDNAF
ncbi:hypothetical protein EC988_002352, partial [Linderina pennispora]